MKEELIHPSAVIAKDVHLGRGVRVHPFAVIEGPAVIGEECEIGAHAVVHRWVRMGRNNRVGAHAVIGGAPQHTGYDGHESWLDIGDDNIFRESITINRAMDPAQPTHVGSGCYFMACAHVGHDCQVGDRVILTNNICLGGHVEVGRGAIIGGGSLIHQCCRVGELAMVAGDLAVRKDVLPYAMLAGEPPRHYRLNSIGLRRNGINGADYRALETVFRQLRANRHLNGSHWPETREVRFLREWLEGVGKRGLYGFARAAETPGSDE